MYEPPPDPEHLPTVEPPTWRGVLSGYVLVGGLLLLAWIASHPAAGVAVLAVGLGAWTAARRAASLARCIRHCDALCYEVGDRVRITVSTAGIDEAA